jgi:hypothetical protein
MSPVKAQNSGTFVPAQQKVSLPKNLFRRGCGLFQKREKKLRSKDQTCEELRFS